MQITIINGKSSFTVNPNKLWIWDNYIGIRYFTRKEYYCINNFCADSYIDHYIFKVTRIYDEELIKELNMKPFRRWEISEK